MPAKTAQLYVSYGQIAIFDSGLDQPFNDWSDKHVAQGFSWRPESVAFSTAAESGAHEIIIDVAENMTPPAVDAVRIIDVPFHVATVRQTEISSISDRVFIDLAPCSYQLRYQILSTKEDGARQLHLCFCPSVSPKFEIILADANLNPSELLLAASPA